MSLTGRWFRRSLDIPQGTSQNERFAERLNSVWFKYSNSCARLGKFLTDLHNRVTKLEAAQPKLPMESVRSSSAGRTATGTACLLQPPTYSAAFSVSPTLAVENSAVVSIRQVATGKITRLIIFEDGFKITVEKF